MFGKLVSGIQELEILVYVFSCNMFAYTIVHLTFRATQIVMCAPVYVTYCKDRNILEQKVNLRPIPLTINPEPTLGIHTFLYKKTTDIFSDLSLHNIFFWVLEEKKD